MLLFFIDILVATRTQATWTLEEMRKGHLFSLQKVISRISISPPPTPHPATDCWANIGIGCCCIHALAKCRQAYTTMSVLVFSSIETLPLIFDKISRRGRKNARMSLLPWSFLGISLIHSFIDLSLHNPNLTLNQAAQNLSLRWGGNCIDCSNTEQSLPVTLCNYPQRRKGAFTEEKYQHRLEYP